MNHTCRGCVVAVFAVVVLGVPSVTSAAVGRQEDAEAGSKQGGDVDAVVKYPAARVIEAVRLALATYGCDIKKDEPDRVECTRSRHMGIAIGSGGEKITVRLTPLQDTTRVVIKTGKGFVGRLGKKNWSTPVFEETIKVLEGK
jgi:hypothetical protein